MHLLTLLLQISVILVVSRLVGLAFRRIGQPQVVGEMAAGIFLGPSLLGWLAPELSAYLFPPASLVHLNTLSQVGLVIFMFLVGLEFDARLMRGRGNAAVVTSHASIVAPFLLGAILAFHLYPNLSDASVSFQGFALFMGAAMSVTAFPVLARILQERNLMRTKVGSIAIACAAVDDVTAWGILAIVIAIVRASKLEIPLWVTLVGSVVYVAVLFAVVRPFLARFVDRFYRRGGAITHDMIAGALLLVLASAFTTEWLGIHALFGAFCVGAIVPKDRQFSESLAERLSPLVVVFLLPLFFANAGLRTKIGLVSGPEMWVFFGLIMLVAVGGKLGGSAIASRATGLSWRESGAIGLLMNTRGLMELVILTIGLDLGVISPALFAMMVMMALVTTFMTTPLLERIYPQERLLAEETESGAARGYTVLLPVSLPSAGPGLLRVAEALAPPEVRTRVYGVFFRPLDDRPVVDLDVPEPGRELALQPLIERAAATSLDFRPLVLTSDTPGRDIGDLAYVKSADLVLMGWHKPVVPDRRASGIVHEAMTGAATDVAVYIERSRGPWQRILVPYADALHDEAALAAALRVARSAGIPLHVLRIAEGAGAPPTSPLLERIARDGDPPVELSIEDVRTNGTLAPVVAAARAAGADLVVIGASREWSRERSFLGARHEALARATGASFLVLRGRARAAEPAAVSSTAELRKAAARP